MPKPNFRYVPHTADVAFVAYGKSFKDALENSGLALLGTMFDQKELKKSKSKIKTVRITERASNKNEIVWFLLQRMVSEIDQRGVPAFKLKVNRISEEKDKIKINACIFCKKSKEYISLFDVKAVTPHLLRVKKTGKSWSIKVLLDV
ncbi:MAG: archease [Candidatus Micrarchaeota archaeon]|nr:archease [Candidatus Micrarchaeota archaeon]